MILTLRRLAGARRGCWGACLIWDMAPCPFCHHGSLRIVAAMTQEVVIPRILRHCKLAAVPPPIAPARLHHETLDGVA